MEKISNVPTVVLPVLAALALGYYTQRKRIIGDATIEGIKALVMNFMLPAVLLGAFYKAAFDQTLVVLAICLFGCCLAGMGLGTLIGKIYPGGGRMMPFLTTGFEAGMMGYGLYAMLFPASETHNFAIVDLGQVLFVFTIYSALLNKQKGVSTSQTLRSMIQSPVFIAIAAGVTLSATGFGALIHQSAVGSSVDAILSYISGPTGVLMIIVVGYQLVWSKACLKAAILTIAVRTLIMGALCACSLLVLQQFISVSQPLFWAIVLMFSLPAPFVLPIFSGDEAQQGYVSGDEAQQGYVATTLSIGTLLSVALFAIISFIV